MPHPALAVGLLCLVTTLGCGDRTPAVAPTPVIYATYAAPVQGLVREPNGGPLANVTVVESVGKAIFVASTDANGRFSFAPFGVSGAALSASVSAFASGHFPANGTVPVSANAPGEPTSMELRLQPTLTLSEGHAIDTRLTNDDVSYGSDADQASGLPPARGPVKLIDVRTSSSGPLEIRATWTGPDRLQLWIEKRDLETSLSSGLPADGAHEVVLRVPALWATDPLNAALLSVGLTGGVHLSADESVHVELGPAH